MSRKTGINECMQIKKFVLPLVLFVTVLGFILRFYEISSIPISLYWDEVSSSYNAYSILLTGKDEFGINFPLLFRAFEDYKTPANIYLTSISVFIFGLNEFSARFSSAFLGALTVPIVFLFIKNLLNRKYLNFEPTEIALLTSLLVAISPWHIQFSRTGFEANSGLFFIVLGAYLFLKFINTDKYLNLYISAFIFGISMYFYRSIWVFVPLLIISLLIIYKDKLFALKSIKKTIIFSLIFFLIILPFVPKMFSDAGMVRVDQTSVVTNSDEKVLESALNQSENNSAYSKFIYNRRLVYVSEFISGYIRHFTPSFLFFQGDGNLRHGTGSTGVLYIWAIIFILPGFYALSKLDKKAKLIIISWLLIAPIPAAISVPAPHALRSLNMIPIPQLIIVLGILWAYMKINNKLKMPFVLLTSLLVIIFFTIFINNYFGSYVNKSSSEWGDGYKQLVEFVEVEKKNYDKVIISGHYWQPYSYFLFYTKYSPREFQDFGGKKNFDKYIFGGTSWDQGVELNFTDLRMMAKTESYLVALSESEYGDQKDNVNMIKIIKSIDGKTVFYVGESK